MGEQRLQLLINYFHKEFDIDKGKITFNSSILKDFEISGDDIDEFFQKLVVDFDIHVIDLNLKRFYVGDEPFDFISPVIRFIKNEKTKCKPTILVSDILKFIDTGVLN